MPEHPHDDTSAAIRRRANEMDITAARGGDGPQPGWGGPMPRREGFVICRPAKPVLPDPGYQEGTSVAMDSPRRCRRAARDVFATSVPVRRGAKAAEVSLLGNIHTMAQKTPRSGESRFKRQGFPQNSLRCRFQQENRQREHDAAINTRTTGSQDDDACTRKLLTCAVPVEAAPGEFEWGSASAGQPAFS